MNQLIKDVIAEIQAEHGRISLLVSKLSEFEDVYNVMDTDPEDRTQAAAIREINEMLSKVEDTVNFYRKRVRVKGYPEETPHGRYAVDGRELHCGIEIEVYEDAWGNGEGFMWKRTHVECSDRYYAVGFENKDLSELLVRVR